MKTNKEFLNTVREKAEAGKASLRRRRRYITALTSGVLSLVLVIGSVFTVYRGVIADDINFDGIDIAALSISKNLMEGINKNDDKLDGEVSKKAVNAATDFAFDLFRAVYDGDNTLISPHSVYTALAMTANGADGQTQKEIEKVLGLSVKELNTYIAATDSMNKNYQRGMFDKRNILISENSVWFRNDLEDFRIRKSFLSDLYKYYDAEAFAAPFDDGTVNDINSWVEQNTEGIIKNMIDDISDGDVMYIINALTFNAKWSKQYEDHRIKPNNFHSADGKETTVDFLHRGITNLITLDNAYGFMDGYQNSDYTFVALLPHEDSSTAELINSLDAKDFLSALENQESDRSIPSFPVFKQEYSIGLVDALRKLGIERAFDPNSADFSDLASVGQGRRLYVGEVIHKTFLEITPSGTTAAAVSAVILNLGGIETPYPTIELRFDRPFVYMILDPNNIPIFIGSLENME